MRLFQSGFTAILLPALLASASTLNPRAPQKLSDTVDLTLTSATGQPFRPVQLTRVAGSETMFRVEKGWRGVAAYAKTNVDGSKMEQENVNFLITIGTALAYGYDEEDRERWWLIVKDGT